MPRVSLGEFRSMGVVISTYVFVPHGYDNPSDYWAMIDDPHVITSVARDLDEAARACARGQHFINGTIECTCAARTRTNERPMLILVQA